MRTPRMLVACEYSGIVRTAFADRGWDAWSCDLRETEIPGQHHTGDIRDVLTQDWDLVIAHPPCTYLTNAGAKHLYEEWTPQERVAAAQEGKTLTGHSPRPDTYRWDAMQEGADFFNIFLNLYHVKHVAIENPVMVGHAAKLVGGKATQFVQPYQFGHMESKRTGLRLKNLPPLVETHNVETEMRKLPKKAWNRVHYMSPGPNREKERSRTATGIAEAMAAQWGPYIEQKLN